MENSAFEKSKVFTIIEIQEYVSGLVAIKTNTIKPMDDPINEVVFDSAKVLPEKSIHLKDGLNDSVQCQEKDMNSGEGIVVNVVR